jgi:CBS-domain-containing membrane protein
MRRSVFDIRDFTVRRQPAPGGRRLLLAGLGAFVVIAVIGLAADGTRLLLLSAAFGASAALVFALPEAPLSQPINVIGGHVISSLCGLVVHALLPTAWWSVAIAVAAAVVAMSALRILHPPAGGNPIVIMTTAAGWDYLLFPTLVGAVVIVLVGVVFHRLTGTRYPLPAPAKG